MAEADFKEVTNKNVGFVSGHHSLPDGARILSPQQVQELNLKTIKSWSPSHEMFVLKHGTQILGGMASLTGLIFISHFRKKMFLRNYGRLASFAPTVFFPGVVASMLQQELVTNKMLSGDMVCPVCAEVRSVSIQLLAGVAQPFILAVLASSALAKTAMTYPLPPLYDVRTLFGVYAKLMKPMRLNAIAVVAMSVANAFVVARNQGLAVEKVHQRIVEQQNYIFK